MDSITKDYFFAFNKVIQDWRLADSFHIKNTIQRLASQQLPGNGWYHAVCALKEIRSRGVSTTAVEAAGLSRRPTMPLIGAHLAMLSRPNNSHSLQLLQETWSRFLAQERLVDVTAQLLQAGPGPALDRLIADLLFEHKAIWTQYITNPAATEATRSTDYEHIIVFNDLGRLSCGCPHKSDALRPINSIEFRQMLLAPHNARVVVAA